jgi:hypothetical protein
MTPLFFPVLFPLGFFVALILIWFFFRSGGYKRRPLDAPPGRDWNFTGERFIDPKSGALLEVWYRPKTGERAYVLDRSGGRLSRGPKAEGG